MERTDAAQPGLLNIVCRLRRRVKVRKWKLDSTAGELSAPQRSRTYQALLGRWNRLIARAAHHTSNDRPPFHADSREPSRSEAVAA